MTGGDLQFAAQQELIDNARSTFGAVTTGPTGLSPLAALTGLAAPLNAAAGTYSATLSQVLALNSSLLSAASQVRALMVLANQQAQPNITTVTNAWLGFTNAASQWGTSLSGGAPQPGRAGPLNDWLQQVLAGFQPSWTAAQQAQAAATSASQPPAGPPTDPAEIVGDVAVALRQLIAALHALGTYVASDPVLADLASVVDVQNTLLTGLATELTGLQTALAAGVASLDADSLAAQLTAIADLRVFTQPDRMTVADLTYPVRMADLTTATSTLLDALVGGPAECPIALLPFRLETRFRHDPGGGMTLRVRIFPDDVGIASHDPDLTPEEASWAATLQRAVAAGGDPAEAAWLAAAARFGPPRTGYLNSVDLTDPDLVTTRSMWPRPPVAAILPSRWLALAYDDTGTLVAAALSSAVTNRLQVAPDQRPDATVVPVSAASGSLMIEPELAWLVDYQAALSAGMAVEVHFDGGAAHDPDPTVATASIARLVVLGVQASSGPGQPAGQQLLADVLTGHRFTGGLQLVAPGTPTNNTDTGLSGYSTGEEASADSYAREVTIPASWTPAGIPTGDASRLACALGISADLLAAAGDIRNDALGAQAMAALTWHASGATVLPWLGVTDAALIEQARSWVGGYLVPSGPLPALRIGSQLYGVLPVISTSQLAGGVSAVGATVARVVSQLRQGWVIQGRQALGADLDSQLSRTPVSNSYAVRVAGAIDAPGGFPAWLGQAQGLMGLPPAAVAADAGDTSNAIGSLAAALSTADSASAAWPPGMLTLPLPSAAAYPVTASQSSADAGFLQQLLTADPVALPPDATVLMSVAAHAWQHADGASTSTAGLLAPRALLGTGQSPPAPLAEPDELHAATEWLASRPSSGLAALFGGSADVLSHRLDAWATAVATERLSLIRQSQPDSPALLVGGIGVIENLTEAPPPGSAQLADDPEVLVDSGNTGYLHAPSLAQAATAAVLRNGYLTHNPDPGAAGAGAAFAIDLSSRRARLASWILDGVRQGQTLAALLGYRFERVLLDPANPPGTAALVIAFRALAPLDPAANPAPDGTTPQESVRATDVVDGVSLYAIWQAQQGPDKTPGTAALVNDSRAAGAFTELADSIDAISDAVAASTLHSMLTGSTTSAAATLAAVEHGAVTADPGGFLTTPRTGIGVQQRIVLPLPSASGAPAGWSATPRTVAEPSLSSWLASVLPDPITISVAFNYCDDTGAILADLDAPTVALPALNLGPLDVLDLAGRPAELTQLFAYHALVDPAAADPRVASATPIATAPGGPPGGLDELLDLAGCLADALASARPADARDLTTPDQAAAASPGVDQNDLDSRTAAASAALAKASALCSAALPGVDPPGQGTAPAQLATSAGAAPMLAALNQAVLLGVPGAAPASAGTSPAALMTLAEQTYAAWQILTRRHAALTQTATTQPDPGPGGTGEPDPVQALNGALQTLNAVFGQLCVAPLQPAAASAFTAGEVPTQNVPAGQDPLAWLVKVAHVRPEVAGLLTAVTAAEAAGRGALSAAVVQDPPGGPWAGGPAAAGSVEAGTLCLTLVGGIPDGTGPLSALVLCDWTETIPSAVETTALTYQFNSPTAQAPQALLLAVPPVAGAPWTYRQLVATVTETIDLAYGRAVDLSTFAEPWRRLVPALYLSDTPYSAAAIPASYPTDSILQPTPVATISAVTLSGKSPVQLLQGFDSAANGQQLHVTGTTLAGISTADIVIAPAGAGVTISYQANSAIDGYLSVTVAPNAALGPRSLQAGSGLPLAAAFTVMPRPMARSVSPVYLAQAMTATQATVTVTGQAMTGATVSWAPAHPGAAISLTLSSQQVTSGAITLTFSIAASTYEPGPAWDVETGPDGKPRPIPIKPVPPRHVQVSFTITVSLAGQTFQFPMYLDEIF